MQDFFSNTKIITIILSYYETNHHLHLPLFNIAFFLIIILIIIFIPTYHNTQSSPPPLSLSHSPSLRPGAAAVPAAAICGRRRGADGPPAGAGFVADSEPAAERRPGPPRAPLLRRPGPPRGRRRHPHVACESWRRCVDRAWWLLPAAGVGCGCGSRRLGWIRVLTSVALVVWWVGVARCRFVLVDGWGFEVVLYWWRRGECVAWCRLRLVTFWLDVNVDVVWWCDGLMC